MMHSLSIHRYLMPSLRVTSMVCWNVATVFVSLEVAGQRAEEGPTAPTVTKAYIGRFLPR